VIEPVSAGQNSLLTGKLTGYFRRIRLLGAILHADTRANSEACSEIPYAAEQGIISAEQGILVQEQGIFPVKSQIIIARLDRHFGRPGRASRT
jgi:hypothetical protein